MLIFMKIVLNLRFKQSNLFSLSSAFALFIGPELFAPIRSTSIFFFPACFEIAASAIFFAVKIRVSADPVILILRKMSKIATLQIVEPEQSVWIKSGVVREETNTPNIYPNHL